MVLSFNVKSPGEVYACEVCVSAVLAFETFHALLWQEFYKTVNALD